jgi:RNA polymerase sigma-70 factor (ECF subfamily)
MQPTNTVERPSALVVGHAADASSPRAAAPLVREAEIRLRRMVGDHFDALWLFARRLGVAESDIDDAMQEVIFVAASRLQDIQPGSERAFLFSTTFRVASELRRRRARRREVSDEALVDVRDPAPGPDSLSDERRARQMLDSILDRMPLDLRAVFVLYEIEERSLAQIAELLSLPAGTVASRLRRGRALFEDILERERARMRFQERAR